MEESLSNRLNAKTMLGAAVAGRMIRLIVGVSLALAVAAQPALAEDVAAIDPAASSTDAGTKSEADSPAAVVETFHAGLLEIMKDARTLGFQGRIDRLGPLMAGTFDLDFMASKTVGRHWKKLTDADKKRWAETFTRFTTANYAGRFTGYTGEKFVTTGIEEAAKGTRMVLTRIIIPDQDDVQLNYRMIQRNGEWRVIDVYLDGTVSELALRRSEYSSALKRDGFEQLCVTVEAKIKDLKSKGQAES